MKEKKVLSANKIRSNSNQLRNETSPAGIYRYHSGTVTLGILFLRKTLRGGFGFDHQDSEGADEVDATSLSSETSCIPESGRNE